MDSEGIKKKVGEKALRFKYDIEDMSTKNKALIGIGAAFAFIIGIILLAFGSRRDDSMSTSGQQGGSSAIQTGLSAITNPNPSNFNTPVPQSPFNFGWVDGNDKAGLQKLTMDVLYVDKDGIPRNIATQLPFEQGREYEFHVAGQLTESVTGKALSGWGYQVNIFDNNHRSINQWNGETGNNGSFWFRFKLKPADAGVFRCRVAAGDAADEDAIVFELPANLTPTQRLLG